MGWRVALRVALVVKGRARMESEALAWATVPVF